MKTLLAFLVLLVASVSALAWDGTNTATISKIEVYAAFESSYGIRVTQTGVSTQCTSGPSWSYIVMPDAVASTFIAGLFSAQMRGVAITISTVSSGGFCQIGYVSFN